MEMLEQLDLPCSLRPIYQDQSGPSIARNHGASLARGEVILFLDDDILAEPVMLERHWEIHESDPWAVVLGRFLTAQGAYAAGQGGWNAWEARILEKHFEAMQAGKRPPAGRRLYSGNFSVRRSLFNTVGGFDESLKRGEDVELGLRMQDAGGHYYFAPEAAGIHCGFRSFESWSKSAYTYGCCDVLLTQEKGRNTLGLILTWFHRQRSYIRVGVSAALWKPWVQRASVRALHGAGEGLFKLGLKKPAFVAYGAIYKIQYWQGVMDQLGGPKAFRAQVQRWKEGRLEVPSGTGQAA
jgi:GT2 family glycosyltransferase